MIGNRRINNLIFRPCTYVGCAPKIPSWSIDKYVPNEYYGKEDNYIKGEDDFYSDPKCPYHHIHKSCFQYPETSYSIATFRYNKKKMTYELRIIDDRSSDLNPRELIDFAELIIYGNKQLNENK